MKTTIMAIVLSMVGLGAAAQTATTDKRIIQVRGEAEREVTPDIIYLSISLKEFFLDNNNRRKASIEDLEKQLHQAAMQAGIDPEDFMINNISSYNYDWNKKKNDPGFLAAKQFRIKVTNLHAVNSLFAAVDPRGVQYSNVDGYDYSGKKELEKELKIQAIQDAKERAVYLAEAVGDEVGKALSISESGTVNFPQPIYPQYRASAAMESVSMDQSLDIDFKKVKYSFTVDVIFELL
ncbi:MAG TPA: SIMPL domain-containing protein [Sphingobacteriaceae bacterium]|nr:SIMPL domain-containing protein [Sphingobacteriaceae bacterium]